MHLKPLYSEPIGFAFINCYSLIRIKVIHRRQEQRQLYIVITILTQKELILKRRWVDDLFFNINCLCSIFLIWNYEILTRYRCRWKYIIPICDGIMQCACWQSGLCFWILDPRCQFHLCSVVEEHYCCCCYCCCHCWYHCCGCQSHGDGVWGSLRVRCAWRPRLTEYPGWCIPQRWMNQTAPEPS